MPKRRCYSAEEVAQLETGVRNWLKPVVTTLALTCLKEDQVKLGLPEGDLHGFRRYFATSMMQSGVSVETVRQWGGWKSLETMLRYLADVSVEDSVQAMAELEKRQSAAS